jgi:hypothetical protein
MKNPIYHHRNLLFFRGKPEETPLFSSTNINQPMGIWDIYAPSNPSRLQGLVAGLTKSLSCILLAFLRRMAKKQRWRIWMILL